MIFGIVLLAIGVLIVLGGLVWRAFGRRLGYRARLVGTPIAVVLCISGALVTLNAAENPDGGWDPFARLHGETVNKFTNTEGFGVNRMRVRREPTEADRLSQVLERVAPMSNAHAEDEAMPKTLEIDGTEYVVRSVQLVGLVKHAEPVVYLTDRLPTMGAPIDIPTRLPDEFEAEGIKQIRNGKKLHVKEDRGTIRMVAPISASAKCVECHNPTGKLLGAFTYQIERVEVPIPVRDKSSQ